MITAVKRVHEIFSTFNNKRYFTAENKNNKNTLGKHKRNLISLISSRDSFVKNISPIPGCVHYTNDGHSLYVGYTRGTALDVHV